MISTSGLGFNHSDAISFPNVISGTGGIQQFGPGVVTLTAVNTFEGETYIGAGTLALSGAGSIASSFLVDVEAASTFDISTTPTAASIMSLGGAGAVLLGSKSLTLTAADYDQFSGVMSGSGSLILSGGSEILSGAGTFSGGATLVGGTLDIDGAVITSSGNGGAGTILSGPAGTGAITFTAGAQTLQIEPVARGSDAAHTFAYTLTGFGDGDVIALRGVSSTDTLSYDGATGLLTVLNGSTVEATLKMAAGLGGTFSAVADPVSSGGGGNTGILITLQSAAPPARPRPHPPRPPRPSQCCRRPATTSSRPNRAATSSMAWAETTRSTAVPGKTFCMATPATTRSPSPP